MSLIEDLDAEDWSTQDVDHTAWLMRRRRSNAEHYPRTLCKHVGKCSQGHSCSNANPQCCPTFYETPWDNP